MQYYTQTSFVSHDYLIKTCDMLNMIGQQNDDIMMTQMSLLTLLYHTLIEPQQLLYNMNVLLIEKILVQPIVVEVY